MWRKNTACLIPSQRVKAHENKRRQEVILLVITSKDVNDSPSVERDEHLTWEEMHQVIYINQNQNILSIPEEIIYNDIQQSQKIPNRKHHFEN